MARCCGFHAFGQQLLILITASAQTTVSYGLQYTSVTSFSLGARHWYLNLCELARRHTELQGCSLCRGYVDNAYNGTVPFSDHELYDQKQYHCGSGVSVDYLCAARELPRVSAQLEWAWEPKQCRLPDLGSERVDSLFKRFLISAADSRLVFVGYSSAHRGLATLQDAIVLPRGVLGSSPRRRAQLVLVVTLQDTKCTTVNKRYFQRWRGTSQNGRGAASKSAGLAIAYRVEEVRLGTRHRPQQAKKSLQTVVSVPVLQTLLVRLDRQLNERPADGGVHACPDTLTTISSHAADDESCRQRCP